MTIKKRLSRWGHVWRDGRLGPEELAAVQQQRLAALLAFARARSPFYNRLYQHLPAHSAELARLPPVTKAQLMAAFDDWVIDRDVTRADIAAFLADPDLVGQPYRGRYAVFNTSGTSGRRGIFLHDAGATAVYDLLWFLRGWLPWLGLRGVVGFLHPGFREVFISATGGHFAGAATAHRLRYRYPRLASRVETLSVQLPAAEMVARLNRLQPAVLVIYPTALPLLAGAQRDGRLAIRPRLIITGAEWLAPAYRAEAAAAFGCPVRDVYGCSEFTFMALECSAGRLHLNADRLILEPVDVAYNPVPPGLPSHTALLTNLVNRVQPIIRYDLGDSITLWPEPCTCGNPLPAIQVEGRRDELLGFTTLNGQVIRLMPMALTTVVGMTPGVTRYQLIQTGPTALTVRLETAPGAERAVVWTAVIARLQGYLLDQRLPGVTLELAADPPRRDPRTGKFRRVWSEVDRQPAPVL